MAPTGVLLLFPASLALAAPVLLAVLVLLPPPLLAGTVSWLPDEELAAVAVMANGSAEMVCSPA
jgi:hypothetical protein